MWKTLLSGLLGLAKLLIDLIIARRASGRATRAQAAPSQAASDLEQAENRADELRTGQDEAVAAVDRAGDDGRLRDQSDGINGALDRLRSSGAL